MHSKTLTGCSAVLRIMGFVCGDSVLGNDYMWDDMELIKQSIVSGNWIAHFRNLLPVLDTVHCIR